MDAPDRPPKSVSSARCARCKVAFDCGGSTRPFDCWCAGLPALPLQAREAGEGPARCLCPACYADALAAAGRPSAMGASGIAGASNENVTL
ncbi:cysteine-rich CWC family protein [Trinickia sp.]|uniref:cysteine-rich CWC family protein n=1 Tax=Trinickia sp. TaxID=2571163 RepID=UPI002CBBCDE7|nr:cysteine-rich CWC family protein [Trinickia sp.]